MTPQPVGTRRDWRLVPGACLVWAGCGVGVGLPGTVVWLVVLSLLVAALGLLRRLSRDLHRRHDRRHFRGRHRLVPVRSVQATAVLSVLLAAAVLATVAPRVEQRAEQVRALDGVTETIRLRLAGDPVELTEGPGVRIEATLLRVGAHPGTALPVLVLADDRWSEAATGAMVRVNARLSATDPGDSRAMLVMPEGSGSRDPPRGWRAVVADLRAGLVSASAPLPPASRGLVPGIAVGDDRAMPPALEEAMRRTSLTHLTAVSGAHVALVLGLVLTLLWWSPRNLQAVVGGLVLVAFVALVHPDGSVLRSAVMGGVLLLGLWLRRPRAALPALASAVVLLLGVDPWMARSYGFALSVLATGGLLVGSRPLAAWLGRWLPAPLAMGLAVPVGAQIACTPVLLLLEPAIPLYAVPANLMAAPVVAPATILGLAAALLGPVAPGAADLLVHAASWCTAWIAAVALGWAGLPGASVPVLPP